MSAQASGLALRPTLGSVSGVFVAAIFLLAPFTWSYVASVGGMLVRAVDVCILVLIAIVAMKGRLTVVSAVVPLALAGLIMLSLLRAIIFSDAGSVVSAIKMSYYLVAALAVATVVSSRSYSTSRSTAAAILLVSPVLLTFGIGVFDVFSELVASRSISAVSSILFRGWNEIFSNNLFGVAGDLEVHGVAFRNSAGMAFLISSLYFFLDRSRASKVAFILLLVVATMMFSRSVWLFQLIFLALILLTSRRKDRFVGIFLITLVAALVVAIPDLGVAWLERIASSIGREEMISAALREFENAWLLGRPEGAELGLASGDMKDVHNVPLAFGLKTGLLGLSLGLLIAGYFFFQMTIRTMTLMSGRVENRQSEIVCIVLCAVLLVRPLVSASHDIYFSIGEWCALGLYLALAQNRDEAVKRRTQKRTQEAVHSAPNRATA